MAVLQARCPSCRETVRLAPSRTRLAAPLPDGARTLAFTCPACTVPVRVSVDDMMAEELRRFGARSDHDQPPRSVSRGAVEDAPPLTYDDLLALHELLERDDWFDLLLEITG